MRMTTNPLLSNVGPALWLESRLDGGAFHRLHQRRSSPGTFEIHPGAAEEFGSRPPSAPRRRLAATRADLKSTSAAN